MGIGTPEIIIIVLILLLLFGGRKIPELMRGLGSGVKEFKKATGDEDSDSRRDRDYERHLNDRREADRRLDDRRDYERPVDDRYTEDQRQREAR